MAADSSALVRAAVLLRGEAPAAWTGFLGALEEYSSGMAHEMMKASPDMLVRGQGMALMAYEIYAILADAPKLYDKMLQTQQRKPDVRSRQSSGF